MDIANSRSLFLAGLEGHASVIRYLVFIMGRSILPLVLLAAFFYSHPSRHLLLCMMICLSMLSMEKSATIFVLLPIMLYFICYKFWGRAMGALCLLVITVGLMTFLATGGNERPTMATPATSETELNPRLPSIPPNMPLQKSMGNPLRFSLPHYLNSIHIGFGYSVNPTKLSGKAITLLNRMAWIPYITAYDWLGFQRTVLHNKLTYGRSISFIHLIYGEHKWNWKRWCMSMSSARHREGKADPIQLSLSMLNWHLAGSGAFSIASCLPSALRALSIPAAGYSFFPAYCVFSLPL